LLELSRTLDNISLASQEYHTLINFKETKESNNASGIIKNAREHFLCQLRILQSLQLPGGKRTKQRSWNYQERWRTPPLQESKRLNNVAGITKKVASISSVSQQYCNLCNFKEPKKETT